MQFVPIEGARSGSGWRVLILLFASLLTLGILQPVTASAAYPAQLTVKNKVVVEGDYGTTTANVKIVLSKRVHHKVSVGYFTKDGTAKAGHDYYAKSGRAYFAKGSKVAYVGIKVKGDHRPEADEFFKVRLVKPFGATIADPVGKVWITNDDKAKPPPPPEKPKLIVRDLQVDEGAKVAFFKVLLLSKGRHLPVGFDFATHDGTAKAGRDYEAKRGHLVIPRDRAFAVIPVKIYDDLLDEADETFFLRVSNVSFATVLKAHSRAVILDNDPLPALAIGDDTATEGTWAHLEVTLTPKSGRTVTVDYDTVGGGSAGGATNADFTAKSGTLTFAPGDAEEWIHVKVVADGTSPTETVERFFVRLSNEVHAVVSPGQRTGTVTIPANP